MASDSERRRRPTETSNFGVSRRETHDASKFYSRFDPPILDDDTEIRECTVVDQFLLGDSRSMSEVEDKSVALVVTSPPYFSAKLYEEEMGSGHIPANYVEYLMMLSSVFTECYRVLEPGGRIAINVANLGRKPYRSLSKDVWQVLEDIGYLPRAEVVWLKGRGASSSAAFGSFAKASNPVFRDLSERILIASKGQFGRALKWQDRKDKGLPWESTISKDDFLAWTVDLWEFRPESAKRVGHPAPFPIELPRRLIDLYTYRGDVILDPFMGAGTTALAAVQAERHFVGYDADPAYITLSAARLEELKRVRRDQSL